MDEHWVVPKVISYETSRILPRMLLQSLLNVRMHHVQTHILPPISTVIYFLKPKETL
jgi:hypothetical protein